MAKPAKGKAKVKITASGKKVSYGQAGKAKDPNSPLRLSRKRWKCSGTKSRK